MLALSWNRSRFYREIFGRAGIREQDLPHVALEQLPVVAKSELVERFDDAVTDQRLRRSDLEAWVQEDADPLHLYLDDTSSSTARTDRSDAGSSHIRAARGTG